MGNALAAKAMASPLRHSAVFSLLPKQKSNLPPSFSPLCRLPPLSFSHSISLSLSGKLEPNAPISRAGEAFYLPYRRKHTLAEKDPAESKVRHSKPRPKASPAPAPPKASEKVDACYPPEQVEAPPERIAAAAETKEDKEEKSSAKDFPRPESIEYNKDLVNCVQLIGTLASEVEISHLDGGLTVALAHIKVPRKRQAVTEEMWFQVEFWNDVAEVAATHLKKSDQIFVSGRVISESYIDTNDNITKMKFKVVAKDLKFVSGGIQIDVDAKPSVKVMEKGKYRTNVSKFDYSETPSSDRDTVKGSKSSWGSKYQSAASSSTSVQSTGSEPNIEEIWKDVFENRSNWWDNRSTKVNYRLPDFKHKSTGKALWITSKYTPAWVHSKLEQLS